MTTEDNLAVIVDYERGATLCYALNAHSPWEGYRIAVNGTEGRAELEVVERAAVLVGRRRQRAWSIPVRLPESARPDRRAATDPAAALGGRPGRARSKRARAATVAATPCCWPTCSAVPATTGWSGRRSWVDGVRSIAVGMAGNESLRTGLPVTIADLGLGVDLTRAVSGTGGRPSLEASARRLRRPAAGARRR